MFKTILRNLIAILLVFTPLSTHSTTLKTKTDLIPVAYLKPLCGIKEVPEIITKLIVLYAYHKIATVHDLIKQPDKLALKTLASQCNLKPGINLVCFDTETTGLSTKNDRIVQIAFATLNSQGRLSTCKMTIDPCIPISLSASRVHGITNQDINGFPKFSQRAQFIYETLHNQIICGYNSKRFDMPLLNNELVRNNMKQLKTKHHIDVMFLAKKKLSLPSYKLGNVYQAISGKKNLDNKQLHDALYDTLTTLATLYNLEVAIGNRASLIVQQANQKTPHISSDVIHKGKLAGRKLDKKLVIRYAHYLEYIKNTKWDTSLNPDQWQKVATYMNKARKDPNTPWFQGNTIFWKSPKNKLHFTFGRYAWEKDLSLDKLLKNENNNGYVSYRKYLVKNKICTEEYLNQAEKCAKEQA